MPDPNSKVQANGLNPDVLPPNTSRGAEPPPVDSERLLRETLNLLTPRRTSDSWGFTIPLEVDLAEKTKLGRKLLEHRSVLAENLDQAFKIIEKGRAIERERRAAVLDALQAEETILQKTHSLNFARNEARRQEELKDAETRAQVAEFERRVRDAEREPPTPPAPPPPPPPPPPQPSAEEKRAARKQEIQATIDRLNREEFAEIAKATGGRLEAEWSEDVQERVKQMQNAYEHAREKKREELGSYL